LKIVGYQRASLSAGASSEAALAAQRASLEEAAARFDGDLDHVHRDAEKPRSIRNLCVVLAKLSPGDVFLVPSLEHLASDEHDRAWVRDLARQGRVRIVSAAGDEERVDSGVDLRVKSVGEAGLTAAALGAVFFLILLGTLSTSTLDADGRLNGLTPPQWSLLVGSSVSLLAFAYAASSLGKRVVGAGLSGILGVLCLGGGVWRGATGEEDPLDSVFILCVGVFFLLAAWLIGWRGAANLLDEAGPNI
jgi:hypothetical protein